MKDRELGLFLNWLIKYYSISANGYGLMWYENAEGEEVSIAEILEHYAKER